MTAYTFYNNFEFILVSSSEKHIDSFVSQNNISNFQKLVVDSPKIHDIMSVSKADYFIFLSNFSILHCDFLFNIVSKINQNFLGDVYYCDEDFIAKDGKRINPFFKPDWSPYLLRSFNYIGNSFVIRKQLLDKLSNFVLDKNFHYDLILHCAEISTKFVHVPIPCCSILKTGNIDQTEVLSQHIQRLGLNAEVERGKAVDTFRVHYLLENEPKVSIIIPTKNNKVIQGPGENAGVIDIEDDDAIVFKIESHNHPSFIEPYQGAATGVGGILRDVFTMGARPIATLNSIHFGSHEHPKTKNLLNGVVSGIGGYGNCCLLYTSDAADE